MYAFGIRRFSSLWSFKTATLFYENPVHDFEPMVFLLWGPLKINL